jgi:hypothetical protein
MWLARGIVVSLLLAGCSRPETKSTAVVNEPPSHARSADSSHQPTSAHPVRPVQAAATVPTEEELTSYLEWWRDWKRLTNRNAAELYEVMERVSRKYPRDDTRSLAADPEYLAVYNRHRTEMKSHMDRKPKGPTATALNATVPALGPIVIHPKAMVYEPRRDEAALAAARAKYGDTFVDWVLAREHIIVQTLSQ